MYKYALSLAAILLVVLNTSAQISIEASISNRSDDVKDGVISLDVKGGEGPYRYVWSNSGTSWYASYASGLEEGMSYQVKVYDSKNDSASLDIKLPAESTQEKMNAAAKPAVNFVGQGVFWDPFAAIGLYDPNIYINEADLLLPLDNDTLFRTIVVSELLVSQGASVNYGQPVARLSADNKEIHLYASGKGKIDFKITVGDTLKHTNASNEVVISKVVTAHLTFTEPQNLRSSNGDPQSTKIPLVVVWLVFGAIFFTIYMKFVNVKGAKHAIELVQGKYDDPDDKGEVSHFQALTTALSGTVGLGNIASVAVAISIGGPGATFWMILAGLLGMSSKFVECTLGVKYREIDEDDGEVHGGPMYYLSKGLAKRNMPGFGKVLAVIFAVLCIGGSFGGGNMFQANQAFAQFSGAVGFDNGVVFGIVLALLVGVVIVGGIKSIAKVTDKIVPGMVGMYVLFALIIIAMNIGNIGDAFAAIFNGAFSAEAAKGGVLGVLIIGFKRAAFSNEAGVGSASIAHAAAKTKEPVSEGIVALLEPFIDTVVVCTMTALVLIFTGFAADTQGLEGAELTSAAFSQEFGWFKYVLTIAIILFAFSTMVSWSYYGLKAWTYLFGRTKAMDITYKVIFLIFVVIGSSISLGAVLDFSDMMVLGMAFPNILGMLFLAPEIKHDMKDYFARIKSGAIKKFK